MLSTLSTHPPYIRKKLKSLRNLRDLLGDMKDWFAESTNRKRIRCDKVFPREHSNELDFHYEYLGDQCFLFDKKKADITCGWQLVRRVQTVSNNLIAMEIAFLRLLVELI